MVKMSSENFNVPVIPKIHIPKANVSSSKTKSKQYKLKRIETHHDGRAEDNSPKAKAEKPQLCASCSSIVIQYLVPLQRIINEIGLLALPNLSQTQKDNVGSLIDTLPFTLQNPPKRTRGSSNETKTDRDSTGNQFDQGGTASHGPDESHRRGTVPATRTHSTAFGSALPPAKGAPVLTASAKAGDLHKREGTYARGHSESGHDWLVPEPGKGSSASNSPEAHREEIQIRDYVDHQHHESAPRMHGDDQSREEAPRMHGDDQNREGAPIIHSNDKSQKSLSKIHHHPLSHASQSLLQSAEQTRNVLGRQQEHSYESGANGTQHENAQQREQFKLSEPTVAPDYYIGLEVIPESIEDEVSGWQAVGEQESPYAFVTVAYNNLSAVNAIILANSLTLTNNKTIFSQSANLNAKRLSVPYVVLITGVVDPILINAMNTVFDEIINEPSDMRLSLLDDRNCGLKQNKVQLWRSLRKYEKCVFLESSTLVIGQITNLLTECNELSACVDWLFPDFFNCSMFVFEPNLDTYDDLITFAIDQQQKATILHDDYEETTDEMSLLNAFFGPKWTRLSFIYNFVQNDAIYTQQPAFMKFGGSIKVVNFGHMGVTSSPLTNEPNSLGIQPWFISFDLLTSAQSDSVTTFAPINNYAKFYLNIFLKRLWPLIQMGLTQELVTKFGVARREWSVFDLVRIISAKSGIETDDHIHAYQAASLRPRRSQNGALLKYGVTDEKDGNSRIEYKEDDSEQEPNGNNDKTKEEVVKPEAVEHDKAHEKAPFHEDVLTGMKAWESGQIDWMGHHQSDMIIQRLKDKISKH